VDVLSTADCSRVPAVAERVSRRTQPAIGERIRDELEGAGLRLGDGRAGSNTCPLVGVERPRHCLPSQRSSRSYSRSFSTGHNPSDIPRLSMRSFGRSEGNQRELSRTRPSGKQEPGTSELIRHQILSRMRGATDGQGPSTVLRGGNQRELPPHRAFREARTRTRLPSRDREEPLQRCCHVPCDRSFGQRASRSHPLFARYPAP